MKKYRKLLFITLITVVFLSFTGCGAKDNTASLTPTAAPSATDMPTSTPTPSSTPTATPLPTKPPKEAFLENTETVSEGDLYRIEFVAAASHVSSDCYLVHFKDNLLAVNGPFRGFQEGIDIVDPKTGLNVCEAGDYVNVETGYTDVADDEYLYTIDLKKNTIRVYDAALKEQFTFEFPASMVSDYNSYYFSTVRKEFIVISDRGTLLLYNYETKQLTEIECPKSTQGAYEFSCLNDDYLAVRCSENETYNQIIFRFNIATRSFEGGAFSDGCEIFKAPASSKIFAIYSGITTRAGLYDEAEGSLLTNIKFNSASEIFNSTLDWTNRCYITYSNMSVGKDQYYELRSYSIDTGELISSAMVPEREINYCTPVLFEEIGIFALYGTDVKPGETESTAFLYYWDYLSGKTINTAEVYKYQANMSGKLKELAETIKKKYGIYVFLGQDVLEPDFDYTVTACTDEDLMYRVLTEAESVFSVYPEGFFEQLKVGTAKV